MSVLDLLIPKPQLLEIDRAELAVDADRAWNAVRQLDLAQSTVARALFGIRTIPDRLRRKTPQLRLRLEDLISTSAAPGFQILAVDPPREIAVGAIGKVWLPAIPFVHVPDAAAFAAFVQCDYVKVAWALRVVPESDQASQVEFELRVAATDDDAWKKFSRYFRLIGPGSHFIRRVLLAQLERDLGTPESEQNNRALPGDALIPDALGQFTHSIVITAPPDRIWPWLVQMGCRRGGFYSLDLLDNGGVPSAHEIRLDLQQLRVGDKIPSTPDGEEHFEVLGLEENRILWLGGLFDVANQRQLPFGAPRPRRFWQVTWAFVLEPLDARRTRLYARARGAFSASERFHAFWIRPAHRLMQTAQLRHLAERAEGRPSSEGVRDVFESVGRAVVPAMPWRRSSGSARH
jgi:proline iminopeptidase